MQLELFFWWCGSWWYWNDTIDTILERVIRSDHGLACVEYDAD